MGDAIEDEMNGDDNEGAGLSTDLSKLPLWLRSVTCSAVSHVQREPRMWLSHSHRGFPLADNDPRRSQSIVSAQFSGESYGREFQRHDTPVSSALVVCACASRDRPSNFTHFNFYRLVSCQYRTLPTEVLPFL